LLFSLITSDIRIKYKNSVLGIFWSMLTPALTSGIYWLVFSKFLKNGIPNFVIYLFSGWSCGTCSTRRGQHGDRRHRRPLRLVKKVSFPREILALANVGASVVLLLHPAGVLALVLLVVGHSPAWNYLWILPISFLALYFFTASVAMVMSALTVYLRDMEHLMDVCSCGSTSRRSSTPTRTPSRRKLHAHGIAWLYFLNPITLIMLTFQRVFYVATRRHSRPCARHRADLNPAHVADVDVPLS
jgi:ABC-type polysaccharide/polyol phosphate export permease